MKSCKRCNYPITPQLSAGTRLWVDGRGGQRCSAGEWGDHAYNNRPYHKPLEVEPVTNTEIEEVFGVRLQKVAS